jgi:hypothetical protein
MTGRVFKWGLWLAGLLFLHILMSCGKRCRDKEILPYPEELDVYMRAYKPGSWWVYESTSGLRDSVYLTEYKESLLITEEKGRSCIGWPITSFIFRTEHMDSTRMVFVSYRVRQSGQGAFVSMYANRYNGSSILFFGFVLQSGLVDAYVIDTTVSSIAYSNALRVDRDVNVVARNLNSIILVQNIGIVAYINETDTFSLTEYHVP